ncbi:TonB-dependent receptor plug domain-containing protein [Flavobacterium nitrogenifigens]|uniref:Iron complex outermembrane recepter protein n=1 Tax=Flavobacterium nitrogenifigens TaxID=1617283 RepID=A0A521CAS0_9FLAO|nr:TonB-dependent receptor [Flavobacterium nitrogenifigens]KAF2327032.1 TonB-dependent receptor [Flavobacterium nitrogenifigens]SMO56557.1 iron complex outermembrane recepter protein [Flavobacterium nitrogenifigens]
MKKNVLIVLGLVTFSGLYAQDNKKEQDSLKNNELSEVTIIGSRSKNRVKTDVPVPVDVFNVSEITKGAPQTSVTQILNYVAPSFTSNPTSTADATDHVDPAQLRGLGPDQVLILVNGKRRHTSALVNINGSPGRGSVGTDLNAIPSFAIERIEVLRDGAAAQYGSDAIAGVINIVLKKNANYLTGGIQYGANLSSESNNFEGGADGQTAQIDLNYGTSLGKPGSFLNITGTAVTRQATSRAGIRSNAIFNAYNAVENRAAQDGVEINSLFSNINTTTNSAQILSSLKQYAPQVSYFTPAQQNAIASASTIAQMQTALNFDVTNNELAYRGQQRSDYNMSVGQSELAAGQLYFNAKYPLSETTSLYSFGGVSYRGGKSYAFNRLPNGSGTFTQVYQNGFLPEIESKILDASGAVGINTQLFGFDTDLSTNLGTNSFNYDVNNTINATLGTNSPFSFDAGKVSFLQSTTNLDFSRKYDVLAGLNVAFGGEFRYENYQIKAGEEASYGLYDVNGNLVSGILPSNSPLIVTDFFGNKRGAGAQGFSGFQPSDAKEKDRKSGAAYVDLELNATEKWLINGAARYENYSDFGNTVTFKLASLLKLNDNINWRISGQTGFRAPSLQQRYFESSSTQFINGAPYQVGYFTNDSQAAKSIGIESLKPEKSKSISTGFTFKIPEANITIATDAYFTRINDRIVLSGQYSRPTDAQIAAATSPEQAEALTLFQQAFDLKGVERASFWTNGIDSETKGIDLVISQKYDVIQDFTIRNDFALSFNETKRVGDLHIPQSIVNAGGEPYIYSFFPESSRVYLEEAIPKLKANLMTTFNIKKLDIYLRNSYFGKVTDPGATDVNLDGFSSVYEHPEYSAKLVTDLSLGYQINEHLRATIGVNNIGDVYPDRNNPATPAFTNTTPTLSPAPSTDLTNANQFAYSRAVSQFGLNGRFGFARLSFKF